MKTDEARELLAGRDCLDKLYGYAYKRCAVSQEAEDLCSDIILAVLKALRHQSEIDHFYAFVWTIAHRVYADHCENRKKTAQAVSLRDAAGDVWSTQPDPAEEWEESETEAALRRRVIREILFLSKIYRDVMVLYYLEENKISDISAKLGISETAVKQRLFSARNRIKKEVCSMENQTISLYPIQLQFVGTGNPVGNDPSGKAERMLSQNLVYLCREEARSVKELSELLNVPMPYIEEEVEIQCRGENGTYGLLCKLDHDKYRSNIFIVDADESEEASRVYRRQLDAICDVLRQMLENSRDALLSFPYLSRQEDPAFLFWTLLPSQIWKLAGQVNDILAQRYFSQEPLTRRPFSTVAYASRAGQSFESGFYGCDGIGGQNLCGYSRVFASNLYGRRIEKHFSCGHNISNDALLLLTLRAIGGLAVNGLSEDEREVAAKALECGYLRKNGPVLEPKIVVLPEEKQADFYRLLSGEEKELATIAEQIAGDLATVIKKNVPGHLLGEYPLYNQLVASIRILNDSIEKCLEQGLLSVPRSPLGAEGMLMAVKR